MRVTFFAVFLLSVLAAHLLLRAALGELYRRPLRVAFAALALHGSVALGAVAFLDRTQRMALPGWFKVAFSMPAAGVLVSLLGLVLLGPLWGPLSAALRRRSARTPAPAAVSTASAAPAGPAVGAPPAVPAASVLPVAPALFTRRRFLQAAAVAPPAALAAAGPVGVFAAADDPYVRRLELAFAGLPAALDGLTVAQVTDVHVGHYVDADDLARALEPLRAEPPDLFVVTGDLIDDPARLAATMAALDTVRPRLGAFACPGNHEHYTGFPAIRRAYDRSSLHLLVDEATAVRTPGGTVEISGADYPRGELGRRMTAPDRFPLHAEEALVRRAVGGDFRLHLVHHPHAWDAARARGADLTLSGHTHGGQVGLGSRSPFEPLYRYVRGSYERDGRRLFVSSGLGHWLPVRIGCPPELAVITLRRRSA